MRHSLLLLALLVPAVASAQDAPADDVQRARSKTCAAFLSELSAHTAGGGAPGTSPSFAAVWGSLLKSEQSSGGLGASRMGHGSLMLDNTKMACERVRARTLGAVMDSEFAKLP